MSKPLTWLEHALSILCALALVCLACLLIVALTSCKPPGIPLTHDEIRAAVDTCERRGLLVRFESDYLNGSPTGYTCRSGS